MQIDEDALQPVVEVSHADNGTLLAAASGLLLPVIVMRCDCLGVHFGKTRQTKKVSLQSADCVGGWFVGMHPRLANFLVNA